MPENEQAADFIGTVRHEMGHALGIGSSGFEKEQDDGTSLWKFGDAPNNPNAWDAHLIDQNGNSAKSGMKIITTQQFDDIKQSDPLAEAEDYFILDEGKNAYFVGKHVREALDGATFDGRNGLPVNGWENGGAELSHLQTTGMMSHRDYSNYTAFMEVELAVMQDLGYAIDRKDFFGYSVYGNGKTLINHNGYSARNAVGTAYLPGVYSTTPLG